MLCLNNLEIREKLHLAVAETRVVDERRVIISFIRVRHMRSNWDTPGILSVNTSAMIVEIIPSMFIIESTQGCCTLRSDWYLDRSTQTGINTETPDGDLRPISTGRASWKPPPIGRGPT